MIRRPPRSTLFPYTTALPISLEILSERALKALADDRILPNSYADTVVRATLYNGDSILFLADRKSTRLNSSHGYISYAVFCLKKKKNYKYQILIRTHSV